MPRGRRISSHVSRLTSHPGLAGWGERSGPPVPACQPVLRKIFATRDLNPFSFRWTGAVSSQQDAVLVPESRHRSARRKSISSCSGNRPSFTLEKVNSPSTVTSNRPRPEGTSVKREISVLFFFSRWTAKLTAWSSYPHMAQ